MMLPLIDNHSNTQLDIYNVDQVNKPEPHEILHAVRKIKDLISARKYEEAAYKIWILQLSLKDTSISIRRKVRDIYMLIQYTFITQRHLRLRGVPNRGWTGLRSRVVTSELLLAIELFLTIEDLASSF